MISDVRNMDCMEFMRQFPDNFFDLAVAAAVINEAEGEQLTLFD